MLKRTPLHQTHGAAGARLVDFGGWEMPLHYGSQIDEHHAVRRAAGMFDVSHMCAVEVEGRDARAFLLALLANDVDKLRQPGRALYSCMLNERGGVIDDLIVYLREGERFRIVVNASTAESDLAWIAQVRATRGSAVTVTPRRDLAMIAIQGPQAREKFWAARPETRAETSDLRPFFAREVGDLFIARTGYTGEDGFEVMLPAQGAAQLWLDLEAAGVRPAGLGARDTLRLEAGMNLYGNDMDAGISPLDAGLAWTVDLKRPRDFIGRGAIERAGASRAFVGLILLDRGVLRAHQKVATPHGEGEITSGTFSPTLGIGIGMARLPLGVEPGDEVHIGVRGKTLRARVVRPPFVRNGKALHGAGSGAS